MTHRMNFHDKFIVFSLRPGEGLKAKGKSRVRGGTVVQHQKHQQRVAEERKAADEHSRSLTMKLCSITEKALDKL